MELPGDGDLDPMNTSFGEVIAAGYMLTFGSEFTNGTHEVRVVVSVDGQDGEFTDSADYTVP